MTAERFVQCLLVASLTLASTPAFAVLASPYQRAAELSAVIEAALPVLGVRTIEQIRFLTADEYEVRSISCVLMVNIVDIETEDEPITLGRRQFEAVAGELECEGE